MSKSRSRTANILDIDTGISRENLKKIANILNDDLAGICPFDKDKKLPLEC